MIKQIFITEKHFMGNFEVFKKILDKTAIQAWDINPTKLY